MSQQHVRCKECGHNFCPMGADWRCPNCKTNNGGATFHDKSLSTDPPLFMDRLQAKEFNFPPYKERYEG